MIAAFFLLVTFAGLILSLVFGIRFGVISKKNFNTLNRINSRYAEGIDIGVSSNDELYDWVSSKGIEGINIQKSGNLINLNGNAFAVDSNKRVVANLPQYEPHVSRRARRQEDKAVPDKIDKAIEIDRIFDKLVKANNPTASIDESFYSVGYSYREKLHSSLTLFWITFAICWVGIIGLALFA